MRAAALALLIAAPATGQTGRSWHYVRSNDDGSKPEAVVMHLAAPGELAVLKAVSPCTQAALVTARFDPASGQASELVGGRLGRDGQQQAFAFIHEAGGQLVARAELPGGTLNLATAVTTRPWHFYEFDLASLNVWLASRPDRRAGFVVGLPTLVNGADGPKLVDHGALEGRLVGESAWQGRPALLFRLDGKALGGRTGTLLIDAGEGHILDARLPLPNHDGYRDFRLRLAGIADGEAAWAARLAAHWQGCKSG